MATEHDTKLDSEMTAAHTSYEKGLSAHAFFKVHNRETSEDLVQNTFLKTWQYLVRGGKIDLMKAFLYHVLNNLIIDEYRKHKTASLDVVLEKGFEPSAGDEISVPDILAGKMVFLLIRQLPEKYERIMRMRFERGLSLGEISLITGQTKNATTVQVHRGLAMLKLLYNPA